MSCGQTKLWRSLSASIFETLDPYLVDRRPDLVLAQGDTTSVAIAALTSFYQKIPFGHVEAGLRTHDLDNPFPEELNRIIAGRVAKIHFVPTEGARRNLLAEGIADSSIFVTGNTVIDALLDVLRKDIHCAYPTDPTRKLILVTAHRRENFGEPFQRITAALRTLHDRLVDAEFVYPVHPNPNVRGIVHSTLSGLERFHLIEPVDYETMAGLMKAAHVIVTDSGGFQEEAPALGKPVFVLRAETERPEAVAAGVAKLIGTQTRTIIEEVSNVYKNEAAYRSMARGISPYGDGHAAAASPPLAVASSASTASKKQPLFARLHEAARGLPPPPAFQSEAGQRLPSIVDLLKFAVGLSLDDRRRRYPCLARFAKEIGLSEEVLIANYEIESIFHDLIYTEPSRDERRRLNHEVYTKVFQLYGAKFEIDASATVGPKDFIVRLLAPLLTNKSILDVGCGAGHFLLGVSRLLEHGDLLGIDVFAEPLEFPERNLRFKRSDIVDFDLEGRFHVAVSDNVYEHIAPDDIDDHLRSIHRALKPDGLVIIFTPHRAFGPFDVTRIVDDSYCGWTPARGTHLNETTYAALAERLKRAGFADLQIIPPRVRGGFRPAPLLQPLAKYLKLETIPSLMRRLQALDNRKRLTAFEICIVAKKG